MAASDAPDLASVVLHHTGCSMNGPGTPGSIDTGVDVWTCGLRVPFSETMDQAAAAHIAAAVRQWLTRDDVVAQAALASPLAQQWPEAAGRHFLEAAKALPWGDVDALESVLEQFAALRPEEGSCES